MMDHLAILSKDKRLLRKIISGDKRIESRWYKHKKPPFNSISKNDTVYFKESGNPVLARAKVKNFLIYKDLNPKKIREIIIKHGKDLCADESIIDKLKDKKFCMLIFLKDVEEIEAFNVNKKGYGIMNAWISVDNINKLKTI